MVLNYQKVRRSSYCNEFQVQSGSQKSLTSRDLWRLLIDVTNLGKEQIGDQWIYHLIYKLKKSRMDDRPAEDSHTIKIIIPYLVSVVQPIYEFVKLCLKKRPFLHYKSSQIPLKYLQFFKWPFNQVTISEKTRIFRHSENYWRQDLS